MIVEDSVIIELTSVEHPHPASKKHLLTYLRLSGKKLGYLSNIGDARIRSGISRVINGEL